MMAQIDFSSKGTDKAFLDMLGGNAPKASDASHIDIRYLIPFENQPFKPYSSDKLQELAEDIRINGVLSPVIVRPMPGSPGLYQILAGHNRVNACKLLGHKTVPVVIKDVNDIKAQLIMVNSNLNQRHELLPSEKAFAYKSQAEAYEKLGAHSVRTTAAVAENNKESRRSIQYYIRLTLLIPELLEMVESGELPMKAGVSLSYLTKDEQKILWEFLRDEEIKISVKQAEQIKEMKPVTDEMLEKLLLSKLEKKKTYIKIPLSVLTEFFDEDEGEEEIFETIIGLLRAYQEDL